MKNIFKTIACLSAALLAFSCVMDEIDTQITDEEAIAQIRLECDALESYTIQSQKPQAVSFRVNSTTPWTITGFENSGWLTVEPASSSVSSLSEDITVKAIANTVPSDRSVTLTISGKNTSISHSIRITQMRMGQLTVEPIDDVYSRDGATKTFSVESNIAWEATAADDWLTLNPASGNSDGPMKTFSVSAVAAANTSLTRTTTVTVVAGDEKSQFIVKQDGHTLEFQPVDAPAIDRRGGELLLGVNATLEWKAESDNANFTVTKVSDTQLKVSAPFNGQFAARTATISLKPVSDAFGDVSGSIEVSQGLNFKFDGNCEVLSDGSVKISCGAKSRVTTLDNYRYVKIVLTMGDVNFGEKGELWCAVNANGCNIYNQLSLGGNLRIRQDGTLPVAAQSTYKNVSLSGITQEVLNGMKEYRFEVLPDGSVDPSYSNVYWHFVNFWLNGEKNASMNFRSVFADDPTAEGAYWFGFYNSTSDGTWYIVKSCDVTPIEE